MSHEKGQANIMAAMIANQLQGGTIRNAIKSDDGFFGFEVVQKVKGRGNYKIMTCWIMCDAEGNGPGWLDIVDGYDDG